MIRYHGRRISAALLFGVSLTLQGCASNPPMLAATAAQAGEGPYTLGAGDKLRVTVFDETALTGEYTITPAGNISFPLIENVPTQGLTVEQLQAAIAAKLAEGYLKDARVSVEVLSYRPYYILGEVNKPGEYPFSVGLDMQQAIAAAGGYSYRANKHYIFLRRSKGAERTVDLRNTPINVLPGDTIRIGERYF